MARGIVGNVQTRISEVVESIKDPAEFGIQYGLNGCFRAEVNKLYNQNLRDDPEYAAKKFVAGQIEDLSKIVARAAIRVWRESLSTSQQVLNRCLQNQHAQSTNEAVGQQTPANISLNFPPATEGSPFDRRLDRLSYESGIAVIPYDSRFADAGTSGFFMSPETVNSADIDNGDEIALAIAANQSAAAKDPFYQGVAAVTNSYALIKLYGSEGGKSLVDQRGERKWYEIDQTNEGRLNYSKNPTTTSIINWGEGDPYGRTPYHFSDFVFCKYWNIVPNNRMITLRRFPAPIVDNLRFPGMDGFTSAGSAASRSNDGTPKTADGVSDIAPSDPGVGANVNNGAGYQTANEDQGSGERVDFPPMATAVTYFGEETENQLSEILKFTTGLNWGDVESDVWEPNTESNPELDSGPAGLFGGLAGMAKRLNIATGNFDSNALLNEGNLPPDPYKEGPYENRIIGPVNSITSVKRRERGLKYENNISLNFEYVARPIGGVNTKAVLLDIISNFLVIGSASAMFWGGQHRFMGRPQTYPFMGGDKGIQQWYRGDPLGWGQTSIESFGQKVSGTGGLIDMVKNFFSDLMAGGAEGGIGGALSGVMKGDNIASNIIKAQAAEKSKGAIPYLTGLRALLIGEPVGEWHLTVGNPLNPIAMIGNLICDSIEVDFGNELGPDDFPLEVKIRVNLLHGMPRDRDAIQSMFNRGMGRIYDLPDSLTGSADYETSVDKYTGGAQTATGHSPSDWRLGTVIGGAATTGGKTGPSAVRENALGGQVSVWNRSKFSAPSPNQQNLFFQNDNIQSRSEFRASTWISRKTTS
jgi:hypothetical protein